MDDDVMVQSRKTLYTRALYRRWTREMSDDSPIATPPMTRVQNNRNASTAMLRTHMGRTSLYLSI